MSHQQQLIYQYQQRKPTNTRNNNIRRKKPLIYNRDIIDIMADILNVLTHKTKVMICTVKQSARIDHSQFIRNLCMLSKSGMLDISVVKKRPSWTTGKHKQKKKIIETKYLSITDKGREFLYHYNKVKSMLVFASS